MLELLATFCAIAEAGSLNKAAAVLHLTQPAVTRQVQALEAQLGLTLLARTPQGARLTPAGRTMLAHAQQVVAAVHACRQAAAELRAARQEHLHLAAGPVVALYFLPPVLKAFRAAFPRLDLDLRPCHHERAIQLLLAHEVDAAIIATTAVAAPHTRAIPLFADPLVLVQAPELLPAGDESAAPAQVADLAGATLLLPPPAAGPRQEVEQALAGRGITCKTVEHPSVETIKAAVALGLGVAILPRSAVRQEAAGGALRTTPFGGWPQPHRLVRVVVRSGDALSPPLAAFVELCRRFADGMQTPRSR